MLEQNQQPLNELIDHLIKQVGNLDLKSICESLKNLNFKNLPENEKNQLLDDDYFITKFLEKPIDAAIVKALVDDGSFEQLRSIWNALDKRKNEDQEKLMDKKLNDKDFVLAFLSWDISEPSTGEPKNSPDAFIIKQLSQQGLLETTIPDDKNNPLHFLIINEKASVLEHILNPGRRFYDAVAKAWLYQPNNEGKTPVDLAKKLKAGSKADSDKKVLRIKHLFSIVVTEQKRRDKTAYITGAISCIPGILIGLAIITILFPPAAAVTIPILALGALKVGLIAACGITSGIIGGAVLKGKLAGFDAQKIAAAPGAAVGAMVGGAIALLLTGLTLGAAAPFAPLIIAAGALIGGAGAYAVAGTIKKDAVKIVTMVSAALGAVLGLGIAAAVIFATGGLAAIPIAIIALSATAGASGIMGLFGYGASRYATKSAALKPENIVPVAPSAITGAIIGGAIGALIGGPIGLAIGAGIGLTVGGAVGFGVGKLQSREGGYKSIGATSAVAGTKFGMVLGAIIGGTIGFFIPLPGATFVAAAIGAALGSAIGAGIGVLRGYINRPKPLKDVVSSKFEAIDKELEEIRNSPELVPSDKKILQKLILPKLIDTELKLREIKQHLKEARQEDKQKPSKDFKEDLGIINANIESHNQAITDFLARLDATELSGRHAISFQNIKRSQKWIKDKLDEWAPRKQEIPKAHTPISPGNH